MINLNEKTIKQELLKEHSKLWNAIDTIADLNNITVSRLAILCGLDTTAFNKSKRTLVAKERFVSSETLSRIKIITGLSWEDLGRIIDKELENVEENKQ